MRSFGACGYCVRIEGAGLDVALELAARDVRSGAIFVGRDRPLADSLVELRARHPEHPGRFGDLKSENGQGVERLARGAAFARQGASCFGHASYGQRGALSIQVSRLLPPSPKTQS